MFSKKPRLRGARAKGITYENKIGKRLKKEAESGELFGELRLSQWFSFFDKNGHGYCQTDILVITPSLVFILECKLTYTEWAWSQLRELYKPVVEKVFERPSIVVQVCRNLHYLPSGMIGSLQELIDNPKDGNNVWHILGD